MLRDRPADRDGVTEGHSLCPTGGLRGPMTYGRRNHPFWPQAICREMLGRRHRRLLNTHRAPWQSLPLASLMEIWPWTQGGPCCRQVQSHLQPWYLGSLCRPWHPGDRAGTCSSCLCTKWVVYWLQHPPALLTKCESHSSYTFLSQGSRGLGFLFCELRKRYCSAYPVWLQRGTNRRGLGESFVNWDAFFSRLTLP